MAASAQVITQFAPNGLGAGADPAATDPAAALATLKQRVQALAAEPMSASQRFDALEALRPASIRAAVAHRALYYARPLPLAAAERAGWEDSVGLWQALHKAYALCADEGLDRQRAATVWQRALDSLGRAIREQACVRQAAPRALWRELNACFRATAACALADIAVEDTCQAGAAASCKTAYLGSVLYDCADPYALSEGQMLALERLLPGWLERVDILAAEPLWASRSPLALDLAAESGARLAQHLGSAADIRYLDTSALGMHLRELANRLRTAEPAAELATAGDLPRPALERLLTQLYVQWCSAGSVRMEERRATRAQAALGMHAVHFQISGRAFRQPGLRYTHEEEHDLATFGHITERTEQRLLTGQSAALEPWEIVDQSVSGLQSMTRKPGLETRVQHGQLIAMRTTSIDPPLLAMVQRLRIEADGRLSIGVRVIRSEVRGAAVRPHGDAAVKYERALVVDADTERDTPAYLILPPGLFNAGATAELHVNRAEKVVITALLDRNTDHDRATYQPA